MAATLKPTLETAAEACARGDAALARAFEFLGKRWNGVVLGNLREGPLGFRALSRAIGGISDSVLSDRLADLVAEPDARDPRGTPDAAADPTVGESALDTMTTDDLVRLALGGGES